MKLTAYSYVQIQVHFSILFFSSGEFVFNIRVCHDEFLLLDVYGEAPKVEF